MKVQIDAKTLAAVAVAQSTEATRYYLNGVCFDGEDAVATDGHMLTVALDAVEIERQDGEDESPILPVSSKAVTALKRRDATHAIFDGSTLSVYSERSEGPFYLEPSAPIDGTFPDWRRVVPEVPNDATCSGMFGDALLSRVASTAKILGAGKSVGVELQGVDASTGHRVRYYNSELNVSFFSVVMPMRKPGSGS